MAKKTEKWYNPQKHTGWRKKQATTTRRRRLLDSTDKKLTMHNRYIRAGRRAQALSNVTTDPATKRLAKADANYFFKKGKKTK